MFNYLIAVAALAGCGTVAATDPTPAKPACPAGEVVVIDDAPTGCDLIGGVNTLTIRWPGADGADEAYYRRLADDAGCAFSTVEIDGVTVAQGTDCDF